MNTESAELSILNSTTPVHWRGIPLLEKVLLTVLPILAIGAIVLRFANEGYVRRLARLSGARPMLLWLVSDSNALFVAGGLLLAAAGILLWRRYRLTNDKRLWVSTGCPYCQDRDLVRVKRKGRDRFYGYGGIPAYRYVCRNCSWRGLRIGRHEYSPDREKELEEAWRRFEPYAEAGTPVQAGARLPETVATQEAPPSHPDNRLNAGEAARFEASAAGLFDPGNFDPPATTEPPSASEDSEDTDWLWRRPSNP